MKHCPYCGSKLQDFSNIIERAKNENNEWLSDIGHWKTSCSTCGQYLTISVKRTIEIVGIKK